MKLLQNFRPCTKKIRHFPTKNNAQQILNIYNRNQKMSKTTTIFCKSFNSVNSDSDNHLYINKITMNNKNIPNSLFGFRKVRIFQESTIQ